MNSPPRRIIIRRSPKSGPTRRRNWQRTFWCGRSNCSASEVSCDARPHPDPLPRGEGEAMDTRIKFVSPSCLSSQLQFAENPDNRTFSNQPAGVERFSLSSGERVGVRIPRAESSRIEPLNLIGLAMSVRRRSVTAFSSGASGLSRLPAGETGSGRRHADCLVTPLVRCSRWGGLSFGRRPGTGGLAVFQNNPTHDLP